MSLYAKFEGKYVKIVWWTPNVHTNEKIYHYAFGLCKQVNEGKVLIESTEYKQEFIIDESAIHEIKPTRAKNAGEDTQWQKMKSNITAITQRNSSTPNSIKSLSCLSTTALSTTKTTSSISANQSRATTQRPTRSRKRATL